MLARPANFVWKEDGIEHEISTAWAGVGIGIGQLIMIGWGLWQMSQASKERNLQLDQQGQALRDQGQALRDQGQVLGQIGQALERQSQAMTQAFTQQGEVLAELLRRTA